MKATKFLICSAIALLFLSCTHDDDPIPVIPAPISGCMDAKSLDYNAYATIDNGNCSYSNATFYNRYSGYNTPSGPSAIVYTEVFVNGVSIGTMNGYYPSGPGNCSAFGTVSYQFQSGSSVDWNSVVYLANGTVLYGTGVASPSHLASCVKVNVTL